MPTMMQRRLCLTKNFNLLIKLLINLIFGHDFDQNASFVPETFS